MGSKKALLLGLMLGLTFVVSADDVSNLFKAYSDQDFSKVKTILKKNPVRPEYRLIEALTLMHNKENKASVIGEGFLKLQDLYKENSIPEYLKLQLELTYARSAQLIDTRRDLYGDMAGTADYIGIYDKIMKDHPSTEAARNAMLFKLGAMMDKASDLYSEEKDGNVVRTPAIDESEKFIASFKGDPKLLIPLRLYLHHIYIAFYKDYEKAIEHVILAEEAGIINPKLAQDRLYQIGRTYQLHLYETPEGKEKAIKYLQMYIKKYPFSNTTPVAVRLIKELQEGK